MMSSENIPPAVQPPDHGHHTTTNTTTNTTSARKSAAQKLPEPPPLKCPRCDSSNTKFCYYNNYSLTQPRHFCKTCRRYWTKGGALRNVPIGGGCRKAKKHKPPTSSSPCLNSPPSSRFDLPAGLGTGGAEFKFLVPQAMTPAMEFQLGGLSLPRLHPATAGVYTQFIASSGANQSPVGPGTAGCFGLDLLGLGSTNYPPTIPTSGNNSTSSSSSSLSLAGGSCGGAGGGGGDQPITISSIESLSSINQEMHWKLQQQRLAMLYGQSSIEDDNNNNNNNDQEKSIGGSINLFKNFESARNNNKLELAGGPTPTEWLFEQIPANYGANNHNQNHDDHENHNNNHEGFNGVWTTDLQHHQFTGLQ